MFRQTDGMTADISDQESSNELKEKCSSFPSDPQGSAFLKLPFSCLKVVILDTGHHLSSRPCLILKYQISNWFSTRHNFLYSLMLNPFACFSLYLLCLLFRMLFILDPVVSIFNCLLNLMYH